MNEKIKQWKEMDIKCNKHFRGYYLLRSETQGPFLLIIIIKTPLGNIL